MITRSSAQSVYLFGKSFMQMLEISDANSDSNLITLCSPLDLTALRAPKSLEIFTAKCRTTEQHQNTKTFVLRIYTSFIYFFSFYCHIRGRLLFEFNSSAIPTIIRYLLLQTLCYCSNHKHKQNEREKQLDENREKKVSTKRGRKKVDL